MIWYGVDNAHTQKVTIFRWRVFIQCCREHSLNLNSILYIAIVSGWKYYNSVLSIIVISVLKIIWPEKKNSGLLFNVIVFYKLGFVSA